MPPPYESHRPVFLIDSQPAPDLALALLRLEVREDTQGMKRLCALFNAWGNPAGREGPSWLHLDGRSLDFGRRLDVAFGPVPGEGHVFSGLISAIETQCQEARPPELQVFAEDALMKLRLTHRSKTYEDMDDAEIVGFIAGQHGLSPDVGVDGPRHKVVQQWNQSDLAFLRERARLLQAEIWLEDQTLHFATREQRRADHPVTLFNGDVDPGADSIKLLQLNARADLAHQRSTVVVSGYDPGERDLIDEPAGADAVLAEAGGGLHGPAVLERSLGPFTSTRQREVPLGDAAARAWARAEMQRRARGFVRVRGLSEGTARIRMGGELDLQGVGPLFGGTGYRVTELAHTFDHLHGHRTAFSAERPFMEPL